MKLIAFSAFLAFSASTFAQTPPAFDIQGHRGTRGLMPENTVPAFLKALELGVDTLELDVVVSRDNKLVVSHEPFFSSEITLDKNGRRIPIDKEQEFNLYRMDYSEIRLFDVGSLGNPRFPVQQKIKTYKPLLAEVFAETQNFIRTHKLKPTRYNIETKSTAEGDDIYHPSPAVFAKLLYDEIIRSKMQNQVMIQSFDVRTLQEFRKFPIKLPLVLLIENKESAEKNIEKLGFRPDVYSPDYSLIDAATMQYCHSKGIKVIPWTVNETTEMEALKKFNVDGIITDYPNKAIRYFRK